MSVIPKCGLKMLTLFFCVFAIYASYVAAESSKESESIISNDSIHDDTIKVSTGVNTPPKLKKSKKNPLRQRYSKKHECGLCEVLRDFYLSEIEQADAAHNYNIQTRHRIDEKKFSKYTHSEVFIFDTTDPTRFTPSWKEYGVLDSKAPFRVVHKGKILSTGSDNSDDEFSEIKRVELRKSYNQSKLLTSLLERMHHEFLDKYSGRIASLWRNDEVKDMCTILPVCNASPATWNEPIVPEMMEEEASVEKLTEQTELKTEL